MHKMSVPNIIDIEASGFGPHSFPIEIGVVKSNKTRYCSLVIPIPSWTHWSQSAQKVHGITLSMLAEYGNPIGTVCDELNGFLQGESVFSDAWSHDSRWLNTLFSAAKRQPSFKMRALEHIMQEDQFAHWDANKAHIVQQSKLTRHRASSDALIIQQTYTHSFSEHPGSVRKAQ